jgi:hypothetical protein
VTSEALRENKASARYTYTAYTEAEYQGVTEPLAYTDTYTDTELKKTT